MKVQSSNCMVNAEDENENVWYGEERSDEYKEKLKRCTKFYSQILAAIIASLGPYLDGITGQLLAVYWAKIPSGQSAIKATREDISFLVTLAPMFYLIGPLVNSYLISLVGRKRTICFTYVTVIIAYALFAFGSSYATFSIGCCLAIVNATFNGSIVALYISEFAAPHLRDLLCSIMITAAAAGMVSGYIISMLPINQVGMILLVVAILFLLLSLTNLESPYYLLHHNRVEDTRRLLGKMYLDEVVESELARLIEATASSSGTANNHSRGWSWQKFKQPAFRKMLLLSLLLGSCICFSGTNALYFNVPKLLRRGCWSLLTPDVAQFIIAAGMILGQLSFIFLIRRVNRRVLYITSSILNFFTMTSLAIFYLLVDTNAWLGGICDILPLALLVVAWFVRMIGIIPVPYLYFRELMSQDVVGIMTFTVDIFIPLAVWLSFAFFEFVEVHLSLFAAFTSCAAYTAFALVVYVVYMPDTQGKLLEEIEHDLGVNAEFIGMRQTN